MKLFRFLILLVALCGSLAFGDFISISPSTTIGSATPIPKLTVTLPAPAPAGGTLVTLTSSAPSIANVVESVRIPAGTTAKSVPLTTFPVASVSEVTFTGMSDTLSGTANLHVIPIQVKSLTPNVAVIPGGTPTYFIFKVVLTAKAPPSGETITFSSSNPHLFVPASISIPGGSLSATFNGIPAAVYSDETARVTASLHGNLFSPDVTILAPTLTTITASPSTIYGGSGANSTITVKLSSPSPAAGLDISIGNNQPAKLSTPASVHFGNSASSATFTASAPTAVDKTVKATLTATYGVTKQTVVNVSSPMVSSIGLSPTLVTETFSSTATVALTGPAGPLGVNVALASGDPATAAFTVSSLHFAAGESSKNVTVNTFHVDSSKTVTLTATLGVTKTTDLTVAPAASLQSVSVDHGSVTGGSSTVVAGTVTLASPAGPEGRTVTLTSSDTSAATVPTTVTVPSGATEMGFAVTHYTVSAIKLVTVTATLGSVVKTTTITVKPVRRPWMKFHGDARNTGRANPSTATGALDWKFQTGGDIESSPAIGADGTIYVGCDDGYMYAVNGTTGALNWKFLTVAGQLIRSSPLVGSDGTIYIGSNNGSVYAVTSAGAQKWSFATGAQVTAPPAISSDGTVLYVGSAKKLYALNTSDGTEKWEFSSTANGDVIRDGAAVGSDGTIYFSTEKGHMFAVNATTGLQKWHYHSSSNIGLRGPSIGDDGTLFAVSYDGNVRALNGSTGAVKWTVFADGGIAGTPAVGTDGTIYVGSYVSSVYAINGSTGVIKWQRNDIAGTTSPAIGDDGTLYVGAQANNMYALDAATGVNKWVFHCINVYSSPAVGEDGTIYFGCSDHFLYKVK